jgi:hypothetical protein
MISITLNNVVNSDYDGDNVEFFDRAMERGNWSDASDALLMAVETYVPINIRLMKIRPHYEVTLLQPEFREYHGDDTSDLDLCVDACLARHRNVCVDVDLRPWTHPEAPVCFMFHLDSKHFMYSNIIRCAPALEESQPRSPKVTSKESKAPESKAPAGKKIKK